MQPLTSWVLRSFAHATPGWIFLTRESKEYQRMAGRPAVIMRCSKPDLPSSNVALARKEKDPESPWCVTNIIPLEIDEIGISQYNAIALTFAQALQRFSRQSRARLQIEFSKGEKSLKDGIPGARTRGFFEQFLAGYPQTTHPSDIHALNIFICALVQYRSQCDPGELRRYLMMDLNWPYDMAERIGDRVANGVELLRIYRDFS